MNKDVIYIDIDDDVTAIIGKIKNAKEKVIALVPPKRAGALQSAVNLRLIDRMAKSDKRRLVLVTSNPALVTLAASANIPVAKNLQSKPELAEVPALIVDNGDDIIDGSALPVGDHAQTVRISDATRDSRSDAIDSVDINLDVSDMPGQAPDQPIAPTASSSSSARGARGAKSKVPNFDRFRKRLVLGIIGGAGLIALLVWMFVFAPAATVVITAKTTPSPVTASVKLGGTAATDYKTGVVSSVSQQVKKDLVIEFDATGQKNLGQKATGSMQLTRTSVSSTAISVPAGTKFTAGSVVFLSTEPGTLEGTSIGPGGIVQDSITVAVQAQNGGVDHNVSERSYSASVGGFSSYGSDMIGGTDKIAKVVSADDIEHAKGKLIGESSDADKKALIKKFVNGEKVIDSSFVVERGEPVSTPAVDAEAADGKAKLTTPVTYTIHAVSQTELDLYLTRYLEAKIENASIQRVFKTGADSATLSNFKKENESMIVTLNATGRVGPKIDEADIKETVKGKIYGEAQSALESQPGISSVDIKFSYFWVRTIPGDDTKIKVEYNVKDE